MKGAQQNLHFQVEFLLHESPDPLNEISAAFLEICGDSGSREQTLHC